MDSVKNISDMIGFYTTNIAIAIVVFVVGKWLARKLSTGIITILKKKGVDVTIINFLDTLIYWILLLVVIFTSLEKLGVDTTSLMAVLGAAGLAIGLALKDSLSNFASGIMLISFRPFKVDDFVTAGGVSGKVIKVNIFNTTLHTPDNKKVIVPNSSITSEVITNVTANETRRVDMVFGISYSDNIQKAKGLIHEVLKDEARILPDPLPVVAVNELADSSVNIIVRPWVKKDDYWDVYFALNEKVKESFDSNGISIPFPQRDVHMYKHKD